MTPSVMFSSRLQFDRSLGRPENELPVHRELARGHGEPAVARERAPSYREEVEAYWVKRYVVAREGYDPDTVRAELDLVAALTAPGQPPDRRNFHNGGSEGFEPPFGSTARVEAAAGSVFFAGARRAVVPFSTRRVFMMSGNSEPSRHWIAVIGFAYGAPPSGVEDRGRNPWGFQVTRYRRVDLASIAGEEGWP